MTETWMPRSGTFRDYPLDPEVLTMDEWGPMVISKGHHDLEQFRAAAIEAFHYENGGPDEIEPTLSWITNGRVEHVWWATRMWGDLAGHKYYVVEVQPWQNGAYPVTVVR